jgi:predicted 2-oxoglutarate/Fe(II)-dependent dioxygenase YbiX
MKHHRRQEADILRGSVIVNPHVRLERSRVFVDHYFFDAGACRRVRAAVDAGVADPSEVLEDELRVDTGVRRTSSVDVDDATLAFVERALDDYRGRIAEFHDAVLTSREGAGFLRYPAGGFYRRHRDRGASPDWPGAARRRITVVVFLNDDFSGGALRLFPDRDEPITIQPRAGTLVAFDAAMSHEVLRVDSGVRDTIVDWFLDDLPVHHRADG